jgi:hypothetical protein
MRRGARSWNGPSGQENLYAGFVKSSPAKAGQGAQKMMTAGAIQESPLRLRRKDSPRWISIPIHFPAGSRTFNLFRKTEAFIRQGGVEA